MSPTPRRRRRPPPDPFPERGLAELGLAAGDQVRFRRSDTERWKPATVARRERDGSVGLHDAKGASRAIPILCIEVRDTGPRGGVVWEPLAERAARTEQLPLVSRPAPPSADRRDAKAPPDPTRATTAEVTAAQGAAAPRPRRARTTTRPDAEPAPDPTTEIDDGPDDGQLRLL